MRGPHKPLLCSPGSISARGLKFAALMSSSESASLLAVVAADADAEAPDVDGAGLPSFSFLSASSLPRGIQAGGGISFLSVNGGGGGGGMI